MKDFLRGIIVGFANILPGISGSSILVIFGMYEKCLMAISTIFVDPKNSFFYLFKVGSGVILGTYLFSNIISYAIVHYSKIMYTVFFFLLLGTVPNLYHAAIKNGFKKKYLITLVIAIAFGLSITLFKSGNDINIDLIKLIFIGTAISFSTVIPGISTTALLTVVGFYNIYIESISNLNISYLLPIMIGFCITTYFLSKIICFLIKNYYSHTYFAILGFSLATIPALLNGNLSFDGSLIFQIVLGVPLAFFTSYFLKKLSNRNS